MPRPRRTRQASTAMHNKDDHGEEPEVRGRSRTSRSSRGRTSISEDRALRAANRSRNSALNRLATEDVTTIGDDTVESVEIGRRAATPQRRDTTGLDLGDDMFGDLDASFDSGEFPLGGRIADNSSPYGGGHMKPRSRSRQSSIIGRNDPPIRPSSRGGNTPLMSSSLNIGAFRRRAREPSILGTGRKARPDVTITTQDHESYSETESEDEFAPEAESTPVNNRRRTRASLRQERESSELPGQSSSRKRKSDDVQSESGRPDKVIRTEESQPEEDGDSDSELSSLPSPGAVLAPVDRPVTPNREDYAAPPASSDPEDDGDFWPDIHGLAKRRRRPSVTDPLQVDVTSNVSSPPSLTHSPVRVPSKAKKSRGRSRTRCESPAPLTTADLANLLPKRRQREPRNPSGMQSDEEYDTTGLGHDQDELSYLDSRTTRRRKNSRANSPRSASRSTHDAKSASKQREAPASNTRSSSRRQTYSRRASDKENESDGDQDADDAEQSMFQPMDDDTFDADAAEGRSAQLSADELKQAAKKFAEVDLWELSFEETSETDSPLAR